MVEYAPLAEKVRRFTELDEHSSPFSYADRLFLRMLPCAAVANGAELRVRSICWDARRSHGKQREAVAREICRWVLRQAGAEDTEEHVRLLQEVMFPASALALKPPRLRVLHQTSSARRVSAASLLEHEGFRPALAARHR